jgi:competence protein ComEA
MLLMNVSSAFAGTNVKVNINTATAEELVQLEKIGPSYASRIVEYRQKHGPFKTPEDIMQVKGIGPQIFELNKARIAVK